jgi:aryl-alcohol dehydrogenase-like predicted oxidoreductase
MDRRTLFTGVAAGLLGGASASAQQNQAGGEPPPPNGEPHPAQGLPKLQDAGELRGEMLYRKLGRTGELVSAIGMGGSYVGNAKIDETEAIKLVHQAIDRGITFMDNSWDYTEGRSERRMGEALSQAGYRNKVFLMTKFDGRNKGNATSQIEESLTRLKTDHVDLIQFHEVLRYDDPDRIFDKEGAVEAALEAKKAGKVRYIGFTGHKDPRIHLYMLEVAREHGFHFDTAQMPLNVFDAHFRSFAHLVVPQLVSEGVGVLGMKTFGGGDGGVFFKSGVIGEDKPVKPVECLHYGLNLPTSVVITGITDQETLDQAFEAAKTFKPMDEQRVAALLDKTADAAQRGRYELFKTTSHFDETAKHPDWLGSDSVPVQKIMPSMSG